MTEPGLLCRIMSLVASIRWCGHQYRKLPTNPKVQADQVRLYQASRSDCQHLHQGSLDRMSLPVGWLMRRQELMFSRCLTTPGEMIQLIKVAWTWQIDWKLDVNSPVRRYQNPVSLTGAWWSCLYTMMESCQSTWKIHSCWNAIPSHHAF